MSLTWDSYRCRFPQISTSGHPLRSAVRYLFPHSMFQTTEHVRLHTEPTLYG